MPGGTQRHPIRHEYVQGDTVNKKLIAALLLAPGLLVACSASGAGNSDNQTGQNAQLSGGSTDEPGTDESTPLDTELDTEGDSRGVNPPVEDAVVDSCRLNDEGAPVVQASISNSGQTAATLVASVDVKQDGARVDGVGLIVNDVAPGESAAVSETGTKTGLRGEITCEVTGLEAVTG